MKPRDTLVSAYATVGLYVPAGCSSVRAWLLHGVSGQFNSTANPHAQTKASERNTVNMNSKQKLATEQSCSAACVCGRLSAYLSLSPLLGFVDRTMSGSRRMCVSEMSWSLGCGMCCAVNVERFDSRRHTAGRCSSQTCM